MLDCWLVVRNKKFLLRLSFCSVEKMAAIISRTDDIDDIGFRYCKHIFHRHVQSAIIRQKITTEKMKVGK